MASRSIPLTGGRRPAVRNPWSWGRQFPNLYGHRVGRESFSMRASRHVDRAVSLCALDAATQHKLT
eukprot:7691254-Pyramimonas_sp.AAC.1